MSRWNGSELDQRAPSAQMVRMNGSLGAAYNIDFSRPIGRLDWFRGFGSEIDHVEAIMSPLLICLPESAEWSRDVTFAMRKQVSINFPIRRSQLSSLGALYYLDDLQSVGTDSSDPIPEGARTLSQGDLITRFEITYGRFVAKLSQDTCILTSDEIPERVRAALELHAPLPGGLGVVSVPLNEHDILLVPCSQVAFDDYGPALRRDMHLLFGRMRQQYPMCFDGLRYHGKESVDRIYPYRYQRSVAQARVEAQSLLPRALAFRTDDGALPFLVRPATTGRVGIGGLMYRYEDRLGRIYLAIRSRLGLPTEPSVDFTRHPTSYAPNFYAKSVWLSAAGNHAERKRTIDDPVYDIAHRFRHFSNATSFYSHWGARNRRGLMRWGSLIFVERALQEAAGPDRTDTSAGI